MMKKRLLCALLLLALALSLLPTVALADDAYTAGTAEELQSLLGQRKTPIKLTDNINLKGQPLTISGGNITIDMDGHTIFGGNLVVHNRKETNLTGGGTIDCCLAELNGTISGDAKFLKKVMLVPDDGCHIYGGSFYGKITTRSSTDAVEFNGGTFYNTVNTAGCNSVTVYGGVFHEDAKFLCGARPEQCIWRCFLQKCTGRWQQRKHEQYLGGHVLRYQRGVSVCRGHGKHERNF